MADWEKGFFYTMKFEEPSMSGEITFDTGGTTRLGISQNAHPEVFPEMEECSLQTAILLAQQVYRISYWCGDGISSQHVANKIVDMRFNMGRAAAVRIAQKSCGVPADGTWGPITEAAVNKVPEIQMLASLRLFAAQHYKDIVATNPAKYQRFINGWLSRANA